jgi:predicted MFS family arabinose efflux permease
MGAAPVVNDTLDLAAQQKRTVRSLRLAQVPGQAAIAGVITVVTLLAGELLGSDRLAGVGAAAFTLGSAFMAVPLAAYMRRRGRRPGLSGAFMLGAAGAVIAGVGAQLELFWLFAVGMVAFGGAQAATLQGRYVAADLAPDDGKARAIAGVVWVGTLGAVFGPVLTPFEQRIGESIGLRPLIGPFVCAAALLVCSSLVINRLLRPDPLVLNGQLAPDAPVLNPFRQVGRAARSIAGHRLAMLGLLAMVISQTSMVAVMTMTPPHMRDHQHGDLKGFVIALHIGGMYGFAPLVGRAVQRHGQVPSIVGGAAVLGLGTLVTVIGGYVPVLVFVGLFLLGLGWNVGLIAGSSLLTQSVPVDDRVEVQGTADLAMSFCGGMAAFASGFVKQAWGFHLLANAATALAGLLLVTAYAQQLRRPAHAAG